MKKHPAQFFCLLLLMALSLPLHAERVLAELEYFYAPDGTLTGKAFNGRRVNFEYDLRGQLLAVTDAQGNDLERYTYDPAGNRLSKTVGGVTTTYTYDEANQLLSSTVDGVTTHYKYAAAGRLVQAGDKSYLYNGRNKVVEVRRNGGTVARFEYNIDGQISKAIYGTKVEEFIWDGLALIWRSGITYINEPYVTGGNPVLASDDVLFNDILGSTLAINGAPVEMTSFGETGNPDAFFTGKPMVDELGYAFLFRDYDPAQGKWTTADQLGYPDGWNNFGYVNNWAIEAIDRLGTDIYHVVDTSGIGHSASIIGNPIDGYYAYNNGGAGGGYTWGNQIDTKYRTPAEALAALNTGRGGDDEYDRVQKWETSRVQDLLAREAARQSINAGYNEAVNNCMHTVASSLGAAGVNYVTPGIPFPVVNNITPELYLLLQSIPSAPIAWPLPLSFYLTNLFFAQEINYENFKRGLVE